MFIESCMYKSVLGKINKLHKKKNNNKKQSKHNMYNNNSKNNSNNNNKKWSKHNMSPKLCLEAIIMPITI